jgi:glycolate oxidase iron-sulfur subunit
LKEQDTSYLNCVHCGKCLPACPSYVIGLNEFFSPRGRVRLILIDNADKLPLKASKVSESLSSCLLCGRCVKICPNGVKIDELVINEKIKLTELSGNFLSKYGFALKALKSRRKIVLKSALKVANIPFFEKLSGRYAPKPEGKSFIRGTDLLFKADSGATKQHSFNYSVSTTPPLRAPLLEKEGNESEIDRHSSFMEGNESEIDRHSSFMEGNESEIDRHSSFMEGGLRIKAGYFSGCVFNGIYPQISVDTVTSLTKNGIEVFVPQTQGCCGLPFISSGDIKSFKELAINNAGAFKNRNLDYIVTSCASCSYSINELYPLYFKEKDEGYGEILNFSKKLLNVWSLFKELEKKGLNVKAGKLKKETSAVFHIPCHLSNSSEFKPSSGNERLIGEAGLIADKINGLKLKPLKYNYCCGNGGMFNIRHYSLSKEITKRKFVEIKEAAPQEILTSCSGCMFSLKDQSGLLTNADKLPVRHLISVYARSLDEPNDPVYNYNQDK